MLCSKRGRPNASCNPPTIDVPALSGCRHLDCTVQGHPSQALEVMRELRNNKQLCDVTLRVTHEGKEQSFLAHRVVLASCSPVFKAMFTSNLRERHLAEVKVEGVCPRVMERLIEFAYTARISVSEPAVLHVLLASMMYQVEEVVKACCDFLVRNLNSSNAIGISNFAEQIGCTELHQRGKEYISMHFNEVTKENEFFNLTHCQLLDLVSQDSLNVLCESEVYKACTEWVRWDLASRDQYFHALLNAVQIYALPPRFLKLQLQECPIVNKSNTCRDFLARIFQEMALNKPLPPTKLRGNQLIYVAGGYLHNSLRWMEAFSPRTSQWIKLADLPEPRSGLGSCVVFGLFYAMGGRNNSKHLNVDSDALDCYNPMTNRWTQRSPMNVPRNRVGVGVIDSIIYAVGGSHGSSHHRTVEKYDPETNCWTFVAPMAVSRIGAGVAVWDGLLYVIGGFDGENRWQTVECYHPETDKWHFVAPMGSVRSGAGVASLDNYIYVVGGFDGTNQLQTVERYSIERDQWESVAPLKHSRSALGVTMYHGKIYALGGFSQEFLKSVECYDPESDQWTEVENMLSARSGMGVAVTMEPCPRNLSKSETDLPLNATLPTLC
ncbi:kelch-like ECH-associated protein 1A [Callorhinchus milii]|nr:kelch-like ECH-associated protein 1A [Callorhinchus milii]